MMVIHPDSPTARLAVGKALWNNFIGPVALDYPAGTPLQDMATRWLEEMGFSTVEWAQPDDHTVLCLLWYEFEGKTYQFILEFTGDRAEIISLFEFTGEVVADGER